MLIGLDQTASRQIVLSIDRTGLLAVQAAAVTSERKQISQNRCGRGSALRTSTRDVVHRRIPPHSPAPATGMRDNKNR
jgi:hypothetical protein